MQDAHAPAATSAAPPYPQPADQEPRPEATRVFTIRVPVTLAGEFADLARRSITSVNQLAVALIFAAVANAPQMVAAAEAAEVPKHLLETESNPRYAEAAVAALVRQQC